MKKSISRRDDMVTIWVTRETRTAINAARDPKKRRITADHVIQDGMAALREKEAK